MIIKIDLYIFNSNEIIYSFTEGQRLTALPTGPGASYWLPTLVCRSFLARQQVDTHGPQTGQYSLCRLRLCHRVRSEKGKLHYTYLMLDSKVDIFLII